jgi:hypothetical protein
MVLSILAYFQYADPRLHAIATHLLKAQMADGGWNCRRPLGATHASMHTTISVLDYFQAVDAPGDSRLAEAIDLIRARRCEGGRWLLAHSYTGTSSLRPVNVSKS